MGGGELMEVTLICGGCGRTFMRRVPVGVVDVVLKDPVGLCPDCWPVVEAVAAGEGGGRVVEMICPDCGHRWLEVEPVGEVAVGCPQCGLQIEVELDGSGTEGIV